jgi:signal transduction histidine kinase
MYSFGTLDRRTPGAGAARSLELEGLTNALRHGGATEILVTLARNAEELVLSVEDNGAGLQSPSPPAGNGLRGLRERLEEFQGVISLDQRTPRGCVLRAVLPEPRAAC